ncbi:MULTISPECIES: hypothetical protein [Microbacterium]|uniref:hypothetical protein n=1 Tax=Microbacterium TaxID=33882 RepID=UPI00278AC693|nr:MULTISPECIES: hypothetical protein [Microbacterium]MDQ1075021.1 hypothetical protein [Microbacterium sp. SORGH_AS_0969]MDQ1115252.1 hypothetical protein [Microbacterium testaceum]
MASGTPPFDPTALTAAVDRAEVRAFTAELRRSGALRTRWLSGAVLAIIGGAIVLFTVPALLALVSTIASGMNTISPVSIFFVLFLAAVIAVIVVAIVRAFRGRAERRYRLDRFARANGLEWRGDVDDPPLPGMIFDQGHSREASDVVSGYRPRFIEVANYAYKTGSGKSETTHKWAYVAIRLDTPLPHIVLDAVGNNGLFGASNLPITFTREQRLGLEGDFDTYFALYCPEGYERDALYLFTPDVMARFIDNAAALDVEIVDDWLFLYARRDLSTLDPRTWEWLFTTVAAIEEKVAQWARWRDERLQASVAAGPTAVGTAAPLLTPPPAGVAPQGRRLKRSVSWLTVAIGVIVVGYWIVSIVSDVFLR